MMMQIALEHLSGGPPPSAVDRKVQGIGLIRHGALYTIEAGTEEEMRSKIDLLHEALRGSGVRYKIVASEVPSSTTMGLEDLEGRMEEISSQLKQGYRSYDALQSAMDIGEMELDSVLQEMVDRGLITAHRGEEGMGYRLAGPTLRAMAR
jgi:hypothetical protein